MLQPDIDVSKRQFYIENLLEKNNHQKVSQHQQPKVIFFFYSLLELDVCYVQMWGSDTAASGTLFDWLCIHV